MPLLADADAAAVEALQQAATLFSDAQHAHWADRVDAARAARAAAVPQWGKDWSSWMTVHYDGPDSMCTRGWFLRIAQQARGRLNQDSPWRHCLKLSDKHPARACALVGNLKPPTHMCIKFCPGSTEHRCYSLLSLTHRNINKNDHYNPTHPYSSVGVGRHNTSPKWHAEVTEGMAAAATTRAGGVASLSGMAVTDDLSSVAS